MEPSTRMYYHGAPLKTMGGCNFPKIEGHVDRLFTFVNQDYI